MSFFFSSRRRHTRLTCDWSSDVCSSDLDATIVSDGLVTVTATCGPASPPCGVCTYSGPIQIGRASCRERVYVVGGAVSREKRTNQPRGSGGSEVSENVSGCAPDRGLCR